MFTLSNLGNTLAFLTARFIGGYARHSGLLAGLLLLAACSKNAAPAPVGKEVLRQTAIQFYQSLYSKDQIAVDTYAAAGYTEHQISAGFTLSGLKAFAQKRATGPSPIIHRTLVQDDMVCLHVEEKVAADSSVAHMVLLRFDAAGKILDHWEAIQGQPRRRANPNTMFDGAAVNYQSTAGSRGIEAVVAADQRAYNQYDTLLVRQTHTPVYLQHNPRAGNGASALIQLLAFLKGQGVKTTLTVYRKVAEGDFILELNNYQTPPAFPGLTNSITFDLSRVDEMGKQAEHWDVQEEPGGTDKSKVF